MSRHQCGPAWHLSSTRPGSWTSPWRSCSARERCISGKSRVLSAEGNTERWSVRVIVEQEIVQQEMSEVQVKNCGCLRGLSAPPPPKQESAMACWSSLPSLQVQETACCTPLPHRIPHCCSPSTAIYGAAHARPQSQELVLPPPGKQS